MLRYLDQHLRVLETKRSSYAFLVHPQIINQNKTIIVLWNKIEKGAFAWLYSDALFDNWLLSFPCHATSGPTHSVFLVNAASGIEQSSFSRGESLKLECFVWTVATNYTVPYKVVLQEPDQKVYSIVSSNYYPNPSQQATYTEVVNGSVLLMDGTYYFGTYDQYNFNMIPLFYTERIPNDAQAGIWNITIEMDFFRAVLTFNVT